ncbi:MAG TPA: outer membrane lipoprotein chaperone LolA [Gemmatimonadaceae bacterium]|jgi:outer membrane lipoprotein carrier protein|nr:outer membrane lipoprotein chaperone LolA [Gemmatimonadaceae bacterium]
MPRFQTLAAVALGAMTAVSLGAQSPETTVDHAVHAYASVKSLRATFTQQITNPLTGHDDASRGELQQRGPGYLSVRFTEPRGDRIVADGKAVWVYLPSTTPGQVIRMPLGDNAAGVPDVAALFLKSPRERYTMSAAGTATVQGHATHAVVLVPRDSTIPFSRATVWVDDDDGLIRQFEIVDPNGLMRHVEITNLQPNAKPDPDAFVFHVPAGVKVFDQRG